MLVTEDLLARVDDEGKRNALINNYVKFSALLDQLPDRVARHIPLL
jgi:hypothetical protein